MHAAAIIELNSVHIKESSINVMLNPFDRINVPPSCFCALKFVPKIARSTSLLG